MARKLPWLSASNKTSNRSKCTSSGSKHVDQPQEPSPKRRRVLPPNVADRGSSSSPPPVLSPYLRSLKTPSTSPPPAPPEQECMLENGQDDIWRMVEDEFLATAQLFTQHLHHAEYIRLKRLAKTRSPATLRAVQRPVDGRTVRNREALLREMRDIRGGNMKKLVGQIGRENPNSSDEELEWIKDHNLAGLLGSPRKNRSDRADLTEFIGTAPTTSKTALGVKGNKLSGEKVNGRYGSENQYIHTAEEDSEAEDYDFDLDGPIHKSNFHSERKDANSSSSENPRLDLKRIDLNRISRSIPHVHGLEQTRSLPSSLVKRSVFSVDASQRPNVTSPRQRKTTAVIGIREKDKAPIKVEEIPTFFI